jgi:VanZ family protein
VRGSSAAGPHLPGEKTRAWLITLAVTLLLGSPLPDRATPEAWQLPGLDKCVHVGLFWLLGLAWKPVFSRQSSLKHRTLGYTGLALYAALTEAFQSWLGWRDGELSDWVADLLGLLFSSLHVGKNG